MRLAVLTTQTSHHAHFVRALARDFDLVGVLDETTGLKAPFPTAHPFETERDRYERDLWFGGKRAGIADFAPCFRHSSLNTDAAANDLERLRADVAVVFGTGKLKGRVLTAGDGLLVNLHGGNPETHRGLDTHLWSIYHDTPEGLAACLHDVAPELDAGAIHGMKAIPLPRGMKLHQLRAANTDVCIELTRDLLDRVRRGDQPQPRAQLSRGAYFSFMPAELKSVCVAKFETMTETPR